MNGLPDNVTICKIEASVIDPNMNEWMEKQDILPNFNEGSNFNPILHDKIELRLGGNEQKYDSRLVVTIIDYFLNHSI